MEGGTQKENQTSSEGSGPWLETGGPAFPGMKYVMLQTGARHDDYEAAIIGQGARVTHYELTGYGMTLRDYFAAKAMAALVTSAQGLAPRSSISQSAYALADAMIEARKAVK